jgi:hypothetical protein
MTKIILLECSPHQYWGLGKKKLLAKNLHVFSNIWNLNFKLLKIKGPIQVLANTLEKNNYINLTFETNANNS